MPRYEANICIIISFMMIMMINYEAQKGEYLPKLILQLSLSQHDTHTHTQSGRCSGKSVWQNTTFTALWMLWLHRLPKVLECTLSSPSLLAFPKLCCHRSVNTKPTFTHMRLATCDRDKFGHVAILLHVA